MEAFLKIIECGNFTDAANKLFISQSTLSTRINSLEKEIGNKLFIRTKGTRKIILTDVGKEFAFASKNWSAFMEDVDRIKNRTIDENMILNIGSIDTYNTFLFNKLYEKLREQCSNISVNIRTYNSTELYQEVDCGRLDIAFTLLNLPMDGIQISKLFEEPRVLLTNRDTLIKKNQKAGLLSQLDKNKEVFFIGDSAFNEWHRQLNNSSSYRFIQVDTDRLLLQLLNQPGYWSIVPQCIGNALVKDSRFYVYNLSDDVPKRVCYRIQKKNPAYSSRKVIEIFDRYMNNIFDDFTNNFSKG